MDTLTKWCTMISRRVQQQVTILDNLQPGIDRSIIKREVKRLDEYVKELDEMTLRLVELSEIESQANAFRSTLEEFEALAVRAISMMHIS